jgi:UDP-N-acetylmuramate dehydrogenase
MRSIESQVPLKALNTFGIASTASQLLRIQQVEDLQQAHKQGLLRQSLFVLGGGSNVVLASEVNALVLKIEIKGKSLIEERADCWIVEAGAGENWHEFVQWTLTKGYPGLENLALIPGCVGATPVQNVGAYGVETKDRFESLEMFDLTTGEQRRLVADECAFAYRDSVFKQALKDRAVITSVRYRLPKPWQRNVEYADLQRMADAQNKPHPTAQEIFDWVSAVRRAKLPDPAITGNAGSFFKNPIVPNSLADRLAAAYPKLVRYPVNNTHAKLAAGWLIDAAGWKGRTMGHAAVHDQHALVLVNRGEATGEAVMALARAIQADVLAKFEVNLEPEPILVC